MEENNYELFLLYILYGKIICVFICIVYVDKCL